MINVFIQFLKDKGYFFEKEIKDIPSSCCITSTIKAIDFDAVKDEFSKNIVVSKKLKSVDALVFPKTADELYFVEMKSYTPQPGIHCSHYINTHFDPLGLPNKIIDSIFVILGMLGFHDADKGLYPYFLDSSKLQIKTILLVNLSSQDMIDLTLMSLDKQNISLTKRINGEIGILNCDQFNAKFI